jgi:hypothetical protein
MVVSTFADVSRVSTLAASPLATAPGSSLRLPTLASLPKGCHTVGHWGVGEGGPGTQAQASEVPCAASGAGEAEPPTTRVVPGPGGPGAAGTVGSAGPVADPSLAGSQAQIMARVRVAFVDDEQANCRLGLRMLARLGVPAANVVVLRDGA